MVLRNPVVFAQMAFGVIPKVFDPMNMRLPFHETLGMIDPKTPNGRKIQGVVAGQGIAEDNTVRQNPLFHDRQEGLPLRMRNDLGVHSSTVLQNAADRDVAPSTALSFALAASTKITSVDFDRAYKGRNLLQLFHNDLP